MNESELRFHKDNGYVIQLKNFEGPFDLLFHLIEKNKLDIYDISISEITDKYIEHILKMKELNLEIASEFIVMASTLLYIKSKSLLPNKKAEEKLDIDSKDELILRLIEYKKYKNISDVLKKWQIEWNKVYYKHSEDLRFIDDSSNINLSLDKLIEAYKKVIGKKLANTDNTESKMVKILSKEKVTVRQKIKDIVKKLIEKSSFRFKETFFHKSKIEVVTGFMAVLELVKLNRVEAHQEKPFADIVVSKNSKDEDLIKYIRGEDSDDK